MRVPGFYMRLLNRLNQYQRRQPSAGETQHVTVSEPVERCFVKRAICERRAASAQQAGWLRWGGAVRARET